MARTYATPSEIVTETGERTYATPSGILTETVVAAAIVPSYIDNDLKIRELLTRQDIGYRFFRAVPGAAPAGGRIMSSLAGAGGLAYHGGIAGQGGGLAG